MRTVTDGEFTKRTLVSQSTVPLDTHYISLSCLEQCSQFVSQLQTEKAKTITIAITSDGNRYFAPNTRSLALFRTSSLEGVQISFNGNVFFHKMLKNT